MLAVGNDPGLAAFEYATGENFSEKFGDHLDGARAGVRERRGCIADPRHREIIHVARRSTPALIHFVKSAGVCLFTCARQDFGCLFQCALPSPPRISTCVERHAIRSASLAPRPKLPHDGALLNNQVQNMRLMCEIRTLQRLVE